MSDWRLRALCARPDQDRDLWTTETSDALVTARHKCRTHCPVMEACRAWAHTLPATRRAGTVSGGVIWGSSGTGRVNHPHGQVRCGCTPSTGAGVA